MTFEITLTDFGNVSDFESHKKGKPGPDEVFLKITTEIEAGKAVPKIEFERPSTPAPKDTNDPGD